MTAFHRLGSALAGLLVGLGVAVFAKAVSAVGFSELVLGHIVGPGLVAAGLLRLRLQRALTKHEADDAARESGREDDRG